MPFFLRKSTDVNSLRLSFLTSFYLFSFALLTIWIYHFAWHGDFHYDDYANLGGLAQVFSGGVFHAHAGLMFVLNGVAGPTGRPLSMLSFLIDGSGWPNNPSNMLYTNSLLHVINGLMLAAVFLNFGRLRNWPLANAAWIAVISAAIWMLLPLLASASLMVVQRMTLLSSGFMLLGLWLYLHGRLIVQKAPVAATVWMLLGLFVGTFLGLLAKEQAALLPFLILILELTLLPPAQWPTPRWHNFGRLLRGSFLWLPALFILMYLARTIWMAEAVYATRDFSLGQRLSTESVILWEYLRLAFFPRAQAFGPFHDDFSLYTGWLNAWVWAAVIGWVVVITAAVAFRKKAPLFTFAVFWFLVAQLLESTVIPLELYFEHRNYLAIAGPVFGMVALVMRYAFNAHRVAILAGLLFLYTLLQAAILFQTTSLAGQPALAAEIWFAEHPKSERAVQYEGNKLIEKGQVMQAIHVLDRAASLNQHPADIELQALVVACQSQAETPARLNARLNQVLINAPLASSLSSWADSLGELMKTLKTGGCGGVITADTIRKLAHAALQNPRFSVDPQRRANMHVLLATLEIYLRDLPASMDELEKALKNVTDTETLELTLNTLNSAGLYADGLDILKKYPLPNVSNPWLEAEQHRSIDKLKAKQNNLIREHADKNQKK